MRQVAMMALCMVAVAAAMVGCKSQPVMSETPATGSMEEPLWVTKGASAFPEEASETFYGVGIAPWKMVPDVSLQRKTAIDRAKDEVAGQLRTFVQGVFKDYSKAAFTPSMDEAEVDGLIESTRKTIVDETLIGAQPVDAWREPGTRDYYALVKLSVDSVASQLRDKIIAVEKDRLRMDAEKAHEELDTIIEKNRNQLKL